MLAAVRLLVLSVWIGLVPACCGYVDWIYPGKGDNNLTFNYIDVVYFTWASSVDRPWMDLWCSPSPSEPQSTDYLYHIQVPTNGSNPRSFPYSDYNQKGFCHMLVESVSGDDFANTPNFNIISKDSVGPTTWGIAALGEAGGSPEPSHIQALPAIPLKFIHALTSVSSSSASAASSATSSSSLPSSSSLVSTITTSPPPFRPTASSTSNDKTTLTPAVKAGISIGSTFTFFVIVLILLLARPLWLRQRRQPAKPQKDEYYGGSSGGPQDPRYKNNRVAAIGNENVSRYEVEGEGMPNGLQGRPRAELFGETGALEE